MAKRVALFCTHNYHTQRPSQTPFSKTCHIYNKSVDTEIPEAIASASKLDGRTVLFVVLRFEVEKHLNIWVNYGKFWAHSRVLCTSKIISVIYILLRKSMASRYYHFAFRKITFSSIVTLIKNSFAFTFFLPLIVQCFVVAYEDISIPTTQLDLVDSALEICFYL